MKTRRDFLKQSGIAAAGLAATGLLDPGQAGAALATLRHAEEMPSSDVVRELMMTALDAARAGGASYSDVRIGRYLGSSISTREQQIVNTSDTDSVGAGIRALVDGTWGFAATNRLTKDGVAAAAREAVVIAKANRIARGRGHTILRQPIGRREPPRPIHERADSRAHRIRIAGIHDLLLPRGERAAAIAADASVGIARATGPRRIERRHHQLPHHVAGRHLLGVAQGGECRSGVSRIDQPSRGEPGRGDAALLEEVASRLHVHGCLEAVILCSAGAPGRARAAHAMAGGSVEPAVAFVVHSCSSV